MGKKSPNYWIFLAAGIWILYGFGYETVWKYLNTEIDGTIIFSEDVPEKGAARYITNYVFRTPSGEDQKYTSGSTDGYLPRSMTNGTKIHKYRWHIGYEQNGQAIITFPWVFYSITIGIAFILIGWSSIQLLKVNKKH